MALIFEEKIPGNKTLFIDRVKDIAGKYNINPNWIMAAINSESNFNPQAVNDKTGATGLIQWLPSTAQDLGTTTGQIYGMDAFKQLEYVDKYIAMQMNNFGLDKIDDFDDFYLLIFYPAAIGKPSSFAFPQSVYEANKGVDINKDGIITIRDFKKFAKARIPVHERLKFVGQKPYMGYVSLLLGASVFFSLSLYVYRNYFKS